MRIAGSTVKCCKIPEAWHHGLNTRQARLQTHPCHGLCLQSHRGLCPQSRRGLCPAHHGHRRPQICHLVALGPLCRHRSHPSCNVFSLLRPGLLEGWLCSAVPVLSDLGLLLLEAAGLLKTALMRPGHWSLVATLKASGPALRTIRTCIQGYYRTAATDCLVSARHGARSYLGRRVW